ncbi:hypothetical protein DDF84_030890 [Cupriavidus metallidurans]|uniref:Uncharacterized protein n=1 Tax=Cupriavidus metallidurans TaxID=119219 RepID=A0A482IXX1_9BURK|nr:hypothetical protein DDF84_030890 [Cupriavidus metallidurans]
MRPGPPLRGGMMSGTCHGHEPGSVLVPQKFRRAERKMPGKRCPADLVGVFNPFLPFPVR